MCLRYPPITRGWSTRAGHLPRIRYRVPGNALESIHEPRPPLIVGGRLFSGYRSDFSTFSDGAAEVRCCRYQLRRVLRPRICIYGLCFPLLQNRSVPHKAAGASAPSEGGAGVVPDSGGPSFDLERLPEIQQELSDVLTKGSNIKVNSSPEEWKAAIVEPLQASDVAEEEIDPKILADIVGAFSEVSLVRNELIDGKIMPQVAFERYRNAIEEAAIRARPV